MLYLSSLKNIILTINLMVVFAILIFIFYKVIKKEIKSYSRKNALSINDIVRYRTLYKFLKYQITKNPEVEEFTLLFVNIEQFETIGKYVKKDEESKYLKKVAANLRMHLPLHGKMAQSFDRPSFIIYLPKVYDEEHLHQIIRIFKTSAEKRMKVTDVVDIQKNMNVTYTLYPSHSKDLDVLIHNLVITMLQVKRQNGNLVMGYDKGVKEIYPERFDLLKKAIKNEDIKMSYMPIYDTINNEVYGTEIQVYWNNPTNEMKTLRDLIFYAETSNDEYWFGLWLFEKMMEAHMNLFKVLETKEYYVFIKVSIKQFDNDYIVEAVEQITKKYFVEPRRIVFEIINPIEANSSIKLMKNIIELENRGYKFCIEVNKVEQRLKAIINEYLISFIKISKDLLLNENTNTHDLEYFAKEKDIEIIVTDIDGLEEKDTFTNRATYLQGELEGFPCEKIDLLTLVTKYRRSL